MLTQVLVALQAHDLPRAESLLRGIIQSTPNHPDAMHLMGVVCGMQGRPNEGLSNFFKIASS
ncbi:tetratricopeptide repeat protein [Polynucleobacter necessarius]|uniref:tetratricopeptide repeat protein n=1 Tax=Polynucleobacter necessarius TaxID=576610 RepID=UPI000E09DD17|nr:tetratricopeptide repeat protein [Polynucleobacter necessarius]